MMPPTMLVPREDQLYPVQTSPDLRRADMYNRARREELDALVYNVSPRYNVIFDRKSRYTHETLTIGKLFLGLRNGIGSALITAGNRIHTPA